MDSKAFMMKEGKEFDLLNSFLSFIVTHLSTPVLLVNICLYPPYVSVHHSLVLWVVHLFWLYPFSCLGYLFIIFVIMFNIPTGFFVFMMKLNIHLYVSADFPYFYNYLTFFDCVS